MWIALHHDRECTSPQERGRPCSPAAPTGARSACWTIASAIGIWPVFAAGRHPAMRHVGRPTEIEMPARDRRSRLPARRGHRLIGRSAGASGSWRTAGSGFGSLLSAAGLWFVTLPSYAIADRRDLSRYRAPADDGCRATIAEPTESTRAHGLTRRPRAGPPRLTGRRSRAVPLSSWELVRRAGPGRGLAAAPLGLAYRFALVYRARAGYPRRHPPP